MIPREIGREHVLRALGRIDRDGVPRGRQARKFALVHDEKRYPPKYVLSIAAQLAIGRHLDPEEYGGGLETNNFLRQLAFDVISIDLEAPSRRLCVARAVLDIGLRKYEAEELGRDCSRPAWAGSFLAIRRLHDQDPHAYRARLAAVARRAAELSADWLLLPACAWIYSGREELEQYLAASSSLQWVLAGAFSEQDDERVLVVSRGQERESFDDAKPILMDLSGVSAWAAISSTIGGVADGTGVESRALQPEPFIAPRIVLDIGHNQYGGRYTRTMKRVLRSLSQQTSGPSAFILSFWHYAHYGWSCYWVEPRDASFIDVQRTELRTQDEFVDYVDLVSLGLGSAR